MRNADRDAAAGIYDRGVAGVDDGESGAIGSRGRRAKPRSITPRQRSLSPDQILSRRRRGIGVCE